MAQLPEVLKPLRKYFRCAGEMQQEGNEPVAYACKMHALQEGMVLMKQNPTAKVQCEAVILPLFSDLEKAKSSIDTKSATVKPAVLQVAMREFAAADNLDRASQWDRTTAAKYNTAYILFEVLKQYDPLEAEVMNKQEYAVYRTKCLAEHMSSGKPMPAPSGGNATSPVSAPEAPGFTPPAPLAQPMQGGFDAPAAPAAPPAAEASEPLAGATKIIYEPVVKGPPNPIWDEPRQRLNASSTAEDYKTEAHRQCKYAGTALMFQDMKTAMMCTQTAIGLLRAAGITTS